MSNDDQPLGLVVGLVILVVAVGVFVLAVAVYAVYIHCCRKGKQVSSTPKPKKRRAKKQEAPRSQRESQPESKRESTHSTAVVVEPESPCAGDVEWENPLVELENVLDEEEMKLEEASQLGSDIHTHDSGFQNGTLERQQPEILEEDPDYQRNSIIYARVDDVTAASDDVTAAPPDGDDVMAAAIVTSRISLHEKSPEPSIATDTLERKEAKDLGRSNSILDRVRQFESSSLVRPAKKSSELEGIRSRVVTGLVTDFEHSDNVLSGRQAPKAGDDIIIMPKVSQSSGEADLASSDPLYAVPDRSRKSQTRKSRPSFQGSENSEQEHEPTPQVPSKADDI